MSHMSRINDRALAMACTSLDSAVEMLQQAQAENEELRRRVRNSKKQQAKIEKLQRQVEALTKQRDNLQRKRSNLHGKLVACHAKAGKLCDIEQRHKKAQAERDTARAQVAVLTDALREITALQPKSMLADCAYQGPPPKTWVREMTPYYRGYNEALQLTRQRAQQALSSTDADAYEQWQRMCELCEAHIALTKLKAPNCDNCDADIACDECETRVAWHKACDREEMAAAAYLRLAALKGGSHDG